MREVIEAAIAASRTRSDARHDDKQRAATLRLISAAIADRDATRRAEGRERLTDDEISRLLLRMREQRVESAAAYENAGRLDAAARERAEIAVIDSLLPEQMSGDEVHAACAEVIQDLEARGLRDTGRCMDALRSRHPGRMDFGEASAMVRKLLR